MIQKMPESEGRPARKGRAPSKAAAARIDRGEADEPALEEPAAQEALDEGLSAGDEASELEGAEVEALDEPVGALDEPEADDEPAAPDESEQLADPDPPEDASSVQEARDGAATDEAAADEPQEPGQDDGDDEGPDGLEGSGLPLPRRLEAVLFASGQSLSPVRLSKVVGATLDEVHAALEALVAEWAERDTALEITAIAGGYRFMTRSDYHADLAGLARKGKLEKLSPAALETLAVVAYRQPITRADIEAVRGVAAGPLLRVLLDRDLIRIHGRSPEPGHPLLYGTSKRFLDHFGLKSLKSLPDIKDLLDVS